LHTTLMQSICIGYRRRHVVPIVMLPASDNKQFSAVPVTAR